MKPEDCKEFIDFLTKIYELYVYTDIAKNPPNIIGYPNYHHKKIDLIKEIKNVSIFNRKFYEFYQEINKIISATKDLHFSLSFSNIDKNKDFYYYAYLPFNFIIKDYEGEKGVFVQKNNYFDLFDSETKEFIESHLNIPLFLVNGLSAFIFDYIQNWSPFKSTKNPHAEFTRVIDEISFFFLEEYPLYYQDFIYNDYLFLDNKSLRLSYKIRKSSKNDYSKEFPPYFVEYIKDNFDKNEKPQIKEIKNYHLIFKDFKKENILKNNGIIWDVLYEEKSDYLKCRVDKINKVNILVQNSFGFDLSKGKEIILKCVSLIHTNDFPLIIIETKNHGGNPILALMMVQLIQMREVNRVYSSIRLSETASSFFKNEKFYVLNPLTCQEINNYSDFEMDTDYYNYNDLNIEHKRSKPFIDSYSLEEREAINNIRRKYENSPNLKRPTDIIIFTDSYSYSATSTLIKGFQNIGGAITVGYFGNPTIEDEIFDSSQSPSTVKKLKKTIGDIEFELNFPYKEKFNDFYQKGNPIPEEYEVNPVDYRVNIYSKYSDDLYDQFVKEGLNIYKKFNEDEYCNSKNTLLNFHDNNNCYNIIGKEHAHGGYRCGTNNKWNKKECVAYYCDIGYYYDFYQQKCIEECKTEIKVFYLYEDSFCEEYTIKKNEAYEFYIFNSDNYYLFEFTGEDILINFRQIPRIFFANQLSSYITINYLKSFQKEEYLKITSIKSNIKFKYKKDNSLFPEDNNFNNIDGKVIIIMQNIYNYLFELKTELPNKISFTNYKPEMNYNDILTGNKTYFKNYYGGKLLLEKKEIYILYFNLSENEHAKLDWNFKEFFNNDIKRLKIDKMDISLQKDKIYIIDFSDIINILKENSEAKVKLMLKLRKESINSRINILGSKVQINSSNYFYELGDINKKLELEVEKYDTLIDILYKYEEMEDTDILDFEEKEFILNKKYSFISIPNNKNFETINFEIKAGNNPNYTVSSGYSLFQYNNLPFLKDEELIHSENYTFQVKDPYKDNNKFLKDEIYTIRISKLEGDLKLIIKLEKKNEPNEKKRLEGWAIALIAISGVIVLVVTIFLILHYRKCCCCRPTEDIDLSLIKK